jgi:phospholipase/carboxylesterase
MVVSNSSLLILLSIIIYPINDDKMNDTTTRKASTTLDNSVLQYIVRAPQVASGKNKAIILLHGVGSNERDLFNLAGQLPDDFYIISLRGPFSLGTERYAWYSVDFSTGKPVYNAEQELVSREAIAMFIKQVKEKYNLDEVYVGGFSQGAIMSYSIGLLYPDEVKGIIAFSGRLLEEIKPLGKKDAYLKKTKVFIAHGIHDTTLPVFYARAAKSYLQALKVPVSYHEYNIGHHISQEIINDLRAWLKEAA